MADDRECRSADQSLTPAASRADKEVATPVRSGLQLRFATDGRDRHWEMMGVGTYARALRRALVACGASPLIVDDRARGSTAAPRDGALARGRRWLRALPSRARTLRLGPEQVWLDDVFRLSRTYFDLHGRLMPLRLPGPPGLIHWSLPQPLRIVGWHNVYTIHDMIPITHPHLTPMDGRRHRRLLEEIGRHAALIVTVSDHSRQAILTGLDRLTVPVVNCGVAVTSVPARAMPPAAAPPHYLLAIGTVEQRKNVVALCKAYRLSGSKLPLVIAGPDGRSDPDIAAALTIPGIVRLRGQSRDELDALIAGATALLMPALAEGFGLPVIEAMASGVPVLTSAGGALAETAGGAALLVDPNDVDALAGAIATLSTLPAAQRAEMIATGRRNAARFTTVRFAAALADAYDRIGVLLPEALPHSH